MCPLNLAHCLFLLLFLSTTAAATVRSTIRRLREMQDVQ